MVTLFWKLNDGLLVAADYLVFQQHWLSASPKYFVQSLKLLVSSQPTVQKGRQYLDLQGRDEYYFTCHRVLVHKGVCSLITKESVHQVSNPPSSP